MVTLLLVAATVAVSSYGSYLIGRATRLPADVANLHPTPPVLTPEFDRNPIPRRPMRRHTYRVMADRDAFRYGHPEGLVVWIDDAERLYADGQEAAYATGRDDEAEDRDGLPDDPEYADAFPVCPTCGDRTCDHAAMIDAFPAEPDSVN